MPLSRIRHRTFIAACLVIFSSFTLGGQSTSPAWGQTTLRSHIDMGEVISPTEVLTENTPQRDASQLSKLLRRGAIPHELKPSGTTAAIHTAVFGLPDRGIEAVLRQGSQKLELRMPLRTLSEDQAIDAKALLRLLAHVSQEGRAHVMVDDRELSLVHDVPVGFVTKSEVTKAYRILVALLDETASLAEALQPFSKASRDLEILGTWTARVSTDDAWAIRFVNNGAFTLVHTRGKKSIVSQGRYRLEGNQLVLTDESGLVLRGAVSRETGAFRWSINGLELNFVKQPAG